MTGYGNPTDLPELLAAVRAKVLQATGLADHLVFETIARDRDIVATPPGDRFVAVRPRRFAGLAPNVMGAGTNARAYAGQLGVDLFARAHKDQVLRSREWLAGVLGVWLGALGGLEQFTPRRPLTDDPLVIEPMRNDPGFEVPDRDDPAGWCVLKSTWDVKFNHRLV